MLLGGSCEDGGGCGGDLASSATSCMSFSAAAFAANTSAFSLRAAARRAARSAHARALLASPSAASLAANRLLASAAFLAANLTRWRCAAYMRHAAAMAVEARAMWAWIAMSRSRSQRARRPRWPAAMRVAAAVSLSCIRWWRSCFSARRAAARVLAAASRGWFRIARASLTNEGEMAPAAVACSRRAETSAS